MEHPDPFTWYQEELQRAAQEQLFGVTAVGKLKEYSNEELQNDVPSAQIPITLLEGATINVKVSHAGYSILGENNNLNYTTLDDLLQSVSPEWNERRKEELCARLDKILVADERD